MSLANRTVRLPLRVTPPTSDLPSNRWASSRNIVFDDSNANGIREAGEVGIPGVRVTVDGAITQTTDVNGFLRVSRAWPQMSAGSLLPVPDGFTALSLTTYDVNIGAAASGFAFALHTPETISGGVFCRFQQQ